MRRISVLILSILSIFSLSALDLSIDEAITNSLTNSNTLQAARFEVNKAEYALKEAEASRLPVVELSASGSYMTNPPEGITIKKGAFGYEPTYNSPTPAAIPDQDYVLMEDRESTYFSIGTTLSQPIFTWGKISNGIKLAEIERNIIGVNLEKAEEEIIRDLKLAYFGAVFADRSVEILTETVSILSEIVQDNKNNFEVGAVTRQTVLEAELNLAKTSSQLIQAEQGSESAAAALRFFTGIDEPDLTLISNFRSALPVLDEESIKKDVILNFPEGQSIIFRTEQARLLNEIQKVSGAGIPDFALNIKLDITGQRVPFFAANWTDSWDANLIITIGTQLTLWDSFANRWKLEQAEEQVRIAETGYLQYEKGMELQVRSNIEQIKIAHSAMAEKQIALLLTDETYKNAKVSFENDLITRQEERGAMILALISGLEFLAAQYEFESSLIQLEYFIGYELD